MREELIKFKEHQNNINYFINQRILILNNFLLIKPYKQMARTRKNQTKVCSVTGLETSINNFYKNQTHVKAVDNLRRNSNATKDQMQRMFNQLNSYV
jgi:hypothetical protein